MIELVRAAAIPPGVVTGPRDGVVDGSCATSFSVPATPAAPQQCLTAATESGVSLVRLSDCDGSQEQLWVLENHWLWEEVMWQRVRPASRLGSCLQEEPRGDGSVSVTVQPCGSDWHQQWKISPQPG